MDLKETISIDGHRRRRDWKEKAGFEFTQISFNDVNTDFMEEVTLSLSNQLRLEKITRTRMNLKPRFENKITN